jgi:hypothetical protein
MHGTFRRARNDFYRVFSMPGCAISEPGAAIETT